MSIDPNLILIDPSPLLKTEIDNIHHDLNKLLNNLRENINKATEENQEELEEKADIIKKLHKEFIADDIRVVNDTKFLEMSMDTRQVVKEKLARCTIKGDTVQLEKKFKDLTVANLNENICGAALHEECSRYECRGALCQDMLGNRKCGEPNCKASVSHAAKETAEQVKDHMIDILNKLQDSNNKIRDAKQLALDTNKLSADSQDRIKGKKETLEREKNETKELFTHVKDYLMDDMVLPKDIEKMARAVLTIQLPGSPDEIHTMIDKFKSLFSNDGALKEDLESLENHAKTAKDLLDEAMDLKKRTKTIDVEITTAISDAQKAHDKAKNDLKDANANKDMTKKQIIYIKQKMNNTENNLKRSSQMDMLEEIGDLKNKTKMNREQVKEAWNTALSAFANAIKTHSELEEVKDFFDILKERNSNQTLQDEASIRLKNITLEADNMKKQVQDKVGQLSDLEKKIQNLIRSKEEKASEVAKLLEKVESLLKDIDKRANGYINCT